MPLTKNIPDPQTMIDPATKKRAIAPNTPLHRLQSVFDSPEEPVLVGDVRDVVAACDSKCKAATALAELLKDKDGKALPKGERVMVEPKDIREITSHLLTTSA